MNNPMTLQDWRDHRDTVKHPHPLCDEAIRSLEPLQAEIDRLNGVLDRLDDDMPPVTSELMQLAQLDPPDEDAGDE